MQGRHDHARRIYARHDQLPALCLIALTARLVQGRYDQQLALHVPFALAARRVLGRHDQLPARAASQNSSHFTVRKTLTQGFQLLSTVDRITGAFQGSGSELKIELSINI